MKTIAVIGAGTMGNGIAHTFAQSGFIVKLIDVSENLLKKEWQLLPQTLIEWFQKELLPKKINTKQLKI